MKSIIQLNDECWVCGARNNLHTHHCYYGVKNRKISDREGFIVRLCLLHHEGTDGVHGKNGHELDLRLKQECQKAYEEYHTRDDFVKLIGRNYLD